MGHSPHCLPDWYKNATPPQKPVCPYGIALPGDVTFPKQASVMDLVAVGYSFVPYVIVVFVVLELLLLQYRRGTRQLALLLFIATSSLLNEFFVKPFVQMPRPGFSGNLMDDAGERRGSCVVTCGMPSSHATMSFGLLMLIFLDGAFRVVPAKEKLRRPEAITSCFLAQEVVKLGTCRCQTPLGLRRSMSAREFAGFYMVWLCLLLPVPIMRVQLADHSVEQVVAGCVLGAIYAVVWFRIMTFFSLKYSSSIGNRFCCGLIVHDYRPAEFRVQVRGQPCEGAEVIPVSDAELQSDDRPQVYCWTRQLGLPQIVVDEARDRRTALTQAGEGDHPGSFSSTYSTAEEAQAVTRLPASPRVKPGG